MAVTLTIRDIPDDIHEALANQAAQNEQSLEDYVRNHLVELASDVGQSGLWDRVADRVRLTGSRLPADEIVELRGADLR